MDTRWRPRGAPTRPEPAVDEIEFVDDDWPGASGPGAPSRVGASGDDEPGIGPPGAGGPGATGAALGRALLEALRLRRSAGFRIDPGRRAALATGALALVAVLATVVWVLAARPQAARVPASTTASGTTSGTSSGTTSGGPSAASGSTGRVAGAAVSASRSGAALVVDVAGKVRHPGLHAVAPGGRVADALAAAGGALPGVDLSTLNLAAKVSDGQLIVVGLAGSGSVAGGSGPDPGPASGPAGPVALNSASADQLDALPGIGPALAARIVEWRTQHGPFASVAQLQEVAGIGPAKYAAIKDLVTL